jgi:hypothetical protein
VTSPEIKPKAVDNEEIEAAMDEFMEAVLT